MPAAVLPSPSTPQQFSREVEAKALSGGLRAATAMVPPAARLAGRFDDPRLTAIGLLEETVSGLEARMTPQLAEHGLSLLEFEVLLRLGRSPGEQLRMADLATQVSLSASGLTRVVDRLERAGAVTRRACDSDRRGTFAVLTPDGAARLAAALPGHLEVLDRWLLGAVAGSSLESMLEGLRQVRDHVNPGAVAGVTSRTG